MLWNWTFHTKILHWKEIEWAIRSFYSADCFSLGIDYVSLIARLSWIYTSCSFKMPKATPKKKYTINLMHNKIYLHTEINFHILCIWFLNKSLEKRRFINKINRSRLRLWNATSFRSVWSFSYVPFFSWRRVPLIFRWHKNICRHLLFIPRRNVLDQNQRTEQWHRCVRVCVCQCKRDRETTPESETGILRHIFFISFLLRLTTL